MGFARASVNGLHSSLLGIATSCLKFKFWPSDNDLIQVCRDIMADMNSVHEWHSGLEEEMNRLKRILDENDLERVPFELLDVFDHLTVHPLIAEVADLPLDDKDDV